MILSRFDLTEIAGINLLTSVVCLPLFMAESCALLADKPTLRISGRSVATVRAPSSEGCMCRVVQLALAVK